MNTQTNQGFFLRLRPQGTRKSPEARRTPSTPSARRHCPRRGSGLHAIGPRAWQSSTSRLGHFLAKARDDVRQPFVAFENRCADFPAQFGKFGTRLLTQKSGLVEQKTLVVPDHQVEP